MTRRDGTAAFAPPAAARWALLILLALSLGAWAWLSARSRCDPQRRRREVVLAERLFVLRRALDAAYAAEHRFPQRIDDLVPKYLRRVPMDPLTGLPDWRFRRDRNGGIVDVKTPVRGTTCTGIAYDDL